MDISLLISSWLRGRRTYRGAGGDGSSKIGGSSDGQLQASFMINIHSSMLFWCFGNQVLLAVSNQLKGCVVQLPWGL